LDIGKRGRTAVERALSRQWFYRFQLPDGRVTTSYLPDDVVSIHDTRLRMLDSVLDTTFGTALARLTCLDIACHEGFFALHMAHRGFHSVLGIDARAANVAGARLMREVYNLRNVHFKVRDLMSLRYGQLGSFDVVLVLGVLYHLENPVGALRIARSHTKRLCLLETQATPNIEGITDWGSYRYRMPIVGAFSVVDETSASQAGNPEGNLGAISLVPSVEALLFAMRVVGFSRVEIIRPPTDGNEQLATGKRVLVAGHV
jgi:tRNA (mo5U34)-methyltransferase